MMSRHPDRSPFLASPSPLISTRTSPAQSWTTIPHPAWTSTSSSISTAAGSADPQVGPAQLSRAEADRLMDQVTGAEFESLPPVVRRKFFSTLERLRFAQASDAPPPPPPPYSSLRRRISTKGLTASRSASLRRRASGRLTKSPSLGRRSVTKDDARWYLDLPDKVKSRHFTREERSFLNGKCASVIMDAADDAYYKRRPMRNPPMSPRVKPRSSLDRAKGQAMIDAVDVADDMEESLQWWDDDGELDLRLRLGDYHANMVPDSTVKPLPADGRSRRPSFRRAALYASRLSGRHWTLPANPSVRSSREYRTKERKRSVTGPPVALSRETRESISADPGAMYYRDPEARLRLRVYLASPQKLDEAIEFGFPTADQTKADDETNPRAAKSGMRFSRSDYQTFLEDGDDDAAISPVDQVDDEGQDGPPGHQDDDDDDDDEASLPEPEQPVTPVELDTTFRSPHRLPYAAKLHSADSTTPRPAGTPRPRRFESYAFAPATSREMTLRITLTRPDLDPAEREHEQTGARTSDMWTGQAEREHHRTSARASNPWRGRARDDPLLLADHPLRRPSEVNCGPHLSHSPVEDEAHNGLVKKFWKKIVKPGRKSL